MGTFGWRLTERAVDHHCVLPTELGLVLIKCPPTFCAKKDGLRQPSESSWSAVCRSPSRWPVKRGTLLSLSRARACALLGGRVKSGHDGIFLRRACPAMTVEVVVGAAGLSRAPDLPCGASASVHRLWTSAVIGGGTLFHNARGQLSSEVRAAPTGISS